MTNLIRGDKIGLARLLSNTSRYIDDFCIVNYKFFDKLIPQIYLIDLEANRCGNNNKIIDYLDVKINVCDSGVTTSVYHKIDDLDFNVTLLFFRKIPCLTR